MARTTIGGDDPAHQISKEDKDRLERALRAEARELLARGKARERKERENRATNISRPESRRAQHH